MENCKQARDEAIAINSTLRHQIRDWLESQQLKDRQMTATQTEQERELEAENTRSAIRADQAEDRAKQLQFHLELLHGHLEGSQPDYEAIRDRILSTTRSDKLKVVKAVLDKFITEVRGDGREKA